MNTPCFTKEENTAEGAQSSGEKQSSAPESALSVLEYITSFLFIN